MAKKKTDVTTVPFLRFVVDVILFMNLVYYGLYIVDRYLKNLSVIMSTPVFSKFVAYYNPFYGCLVGLGCVILLKVIGLIRNYVNTALILMILSLLLSFVFRW